MSDVEKKISELWGKQIKKECPELTNLEGILNHLSLRNQLKNMFAKTKAGDLMGNVSLVDGHIDEPRQTNYDRIRAMSVEEMAEEFSKIYPPNEVMLRHKVKMKVMNWLIQEVDNGK